MYNIQSIHYLIGLHIIVFLFASGVTQVNGQSLKFERLIPFPAKHINAIAVDKYNVKWLATENGLVAFQQSGKYQIYQEQNSSIYDNQLNTITIDNQDNKWLGTYSKGLICLTNKGEFKRYPFANSKILLITSVLINDVDSLITTATDGVYQLNSGKLIPKWRMNNSKLLSNRVNVIRKTKENTWLIGTAKGLCEVRSAKWKSYKLGNIKDIQQVEEKTYASSLTVEGPEFWVKSKSNWEMVEHQVFNFDFQLKDIVFSASSFWIVSDKGLIRFNGYNHQLFDMRYGLNPSISAIALDEKDSIWVGTNGKGLYGLKTSKEQMIIEPSLARDGIIPNKILRLKHAIFKQSSTVFEDSLVYDELQVLIRFLHENPTSVVEIHGHTDNTGSQIENWKLSKKRAQLIAAYIIAKGIDSERVTSKWFGENKPLVSNNTLVNKKQNRRIEIYVTVQR